MALVKCKVCGREIEDDVIKCPHCDSLGPKKGKRIKIILLVVMLLLAAGFGVSFYLNKDRVEKPYEEIVAGTARCATVAAGFDGCLVVEKPTRPSGVDGVAVGYFQ